MILHAFITEPSCSSGKQLSMRPFVLRRSLGCAAECFSSHQLMVRMASPSLLLDTISIIWSMDLVDLAWYVSFTSFLPASVSTRRSASALLWLR